MENKNLIILFALVLVASFVGALLGAYLVEKTLTPTYTTQGVSQTPYTIPSNGGAVPPGGAQQPQGAPQYPQYPQYPSGANQPQGGQAPNGAPQQATPPQPAR